MFSDSIVHPDNIGTSLDGMTFGADELSTVDLSNEDFNSMFEQVIAQSRPSAGRAVLVRFSAFQEVLFVPF